MIRDILIGRTTRPITSGDGYLARVPAVDTDNSRLAGPLKLLP